MHLVLTTHRFPQYNESFLHDHVLAMTHFGEHVTVLAHGAGDHAPRDEGAPGRLRLTIAPWYDPRPKKVLTLARDLRRAAACNPSELRAFVRLLGRERGYGTSMLQTLYASVPVLTAPLDLLHIAWIKFAIQAPELLEVLDVPIVVSCQGNDLRVDPLEIEGFAANARHVFDRVDLVHCVSHDLAGMAMDLAPTRRRCSSTTGASTRRTSARATHPTGQRPGGSRSSASGG